MDHEVSWTDPALADFEAIIRYLAERSPSGAEAVRLDILDAVERLVRFPYLGPVYDRDPGGRTREILCRVYRIFYRVHDAARRVEVLTVWHGSRQEPDLPL